MANSGARRRCRGGGLGPGGLAGRAAPTTQQQQCTSLHCCCWRRRGWTRRHHRPGMYSTDVHQVTRSAFWLPIRRSLNCLHPFPCPRKQAADYPAPAITTGVGVAQPTTAVQRPAAAVIQKPLAKQMLPVPGEEEEGETPDEDQSSPTSLPAPTAPGADGSDAVIVDAALAAGCRPMNGVELKFFVESTFMRSMCVAWVPERLARVRLLPLPTHASKPTIHHQTHRLDLRRHPARALDNLRAHGVHPRPAGATRDSHGCVRRHTNHMLTLPTAFAPVPPYP